MFMKYWYTIILCFPNVLNIPVLYELCMRTHGWATWCYLKAVLYLYLHIISTIIQITTQNQKNSSQKGK